MRNFIYSSTARYIVSELIIMSYQDIIEEEQKSVIYIDNEDTLKYLHNPLYLPILKILRLGYKTFKEIKEEYVTHSSTVPPDKTLYRHLNSLKEVGLIFEFGKRVYKGQSMTEKLFSRTAKFFHSAKKMDDDEYDSKIKKQSKILSKFFSLAYNVPDVKAGCLEVLLKKLHSVDLEGISAIFQKFPDEIADIAGNLPHEELQAVVDEYIRLNSVIASPNILEELKKCLDLK